MPLVIDINELPHYTVPLRDVKRMATVLQKQGQIEPIVLDWSMNLKFNWYDEAIVEAARHLGWDTILITWFGEGNPN